MTKKNGTKRSLLMSALALVLCLSMLVGSTFAWFTDSVTSSGNIIKSGTLDVDIVTADGLTSLEGSNLKFQDLNGAIDILWEPGATFRTQAFKIKSTGTLALKYRLVLNGVEGDAELLEAITFSIVDASGNDVNLSEFEGVLTAADALSGEYYIQGVMSTAAGNEYQGKTLEGIGVTVIATQKDAEFDAFGNTYDKDATYPVVSAPVVIPSAGNDVEDVTVKTEQVEVTVPAEVVEALTSNATPEPVTSVALVHTEPVVDVVEKKITFDAVDLVDQNGKVIDLEAMTTTAPVSVTLNVGTAFAVGDVVAIYHDDVEVARATVDAEKNIMYTVAHFCEVTIVSGGTIVSTEAELNKAIANGDNVVLAKDIQLTKTLLVKKDVVIDLNGKAMTAPSSGNMFQSYSNDEPSMTITSSVAGAAINVTGGDTSVLLGYGSTEISNVTINVTGCDNYSPNPFNVYGDLTLGEGTVVNVDYLGTALISNNGAVDIVIDGAEINIGTFKTNGTAIITLNQASTLDMKNTSVKIDNFVLSSFGGDSLVSKVDGVTIENCTFDVTDSNGASCTFEAKNGKYRLVQN